MLKNNWLFDSRWIGSHGIGRFASELSSRLSIPDLDIGGFPFDLLDPIRLSMKMATSGKYLFSPGYNSPILGVDRCVFTIHDLNHIDVGNNIAKHLYYGQIMKKACHKSIKVLTVSEFSRARIIEWAGVCERHVVNVGNGVSLSFGPDGPRYNPGFKYFLSVGNRKAHKNEVRLFAAFSRACIDKTIRLVLTGTPSRELIAASHRYGINDRVTYLGFRNELELASIYRGAIGLLFPSLYEGFGLPVIEAQASRIPVLTSNTSSLPEVAGKGALLVNPVDIDDISIGIELLANDAKLIDKLVEYGIDNIKRYSWESVANNVGHVLEGI